MHRSIFLIAVSIFALLGGCASTAPKANYGHDLVSQYKLDADDVPHVTLTANSGVELAELDKQRITGVIVTKLDERRAKNLANGDRKDCTVVVNITKYQKGNAFARAMLAGLGQIHIDGDVTVLANANSERIAHFTVAKTFAWGGIYGASTSMEDIERTFADGVASALTGQEDTKTAAAQKSQ